MKCFILARQSSGDSVESLSIDSQVDECRKLCKAEGFDIVDEFLDYNTSGRLYPVGFEEVSKIDLIYQKWTAETGKKNFRIGLGKALKRLSEVDCIVCYDITRLHRSLNGSFLSSLISQHLVSNSVKVWTVKEGRLDFGKFTDSLVTNLTSQINSEQLQIQREKSKASTKRLKDSGEWNVQCSKSFGYKSTGRKREVEVDEFKADIVKEVYRRYISGESYYKICHSVNARLFEKTGKILSKTHMLRILRNPIYTGYYKDSSGQLVKAKPIIGKEIVPIDEWKKAQEIYAQRKIYPKRAYVNWLPLSGRVFCGECGFPMPAITANVSFVQYRCMSYSKHGYGKERSCKNGVSWNSKTDSELGDYMKQALFGLLPIYYLDRVKSSENKSSVSEEIETLSISLINIKAKQESISKLYMDGVIDDDMFSDMQRKLKMKAKEANERIEELEASLKKNEITFIDMLVSCEQLSRGEVEEDELNEAFDFVFKKIVIFKDRIDITTPLGQVSLPIVRRWRSKLFPFHKVLTDEKNVYVVYYFNDYDDEEKWKSIAKFEGIEFFLAD